MAQYSLSSLYYDFIPTSFISNSVPINVVIKQILTNAVTGKSEHIDNDDYFPTIITLNPLVQQIDVKTSLKAIDDFYKRRNKFSPKYVRQSFCTRQNFELYIESKPTCFLVLGKLAPARYTLAKYIAKKTNRRHIDVIRLVAREIIKNTPLGNWIWGNLVWGKKIPDDIAMKLLIDELEKPKYKRHGYVLSGLPLVPCVTLTENILPFALGKFPCVPPPYVSKRRENLSNERSVSDLESEFELGKSEEQEGGEDFIESGEQEARSKISEEDGSEEEFVTGSEESEDEDVERDVRRLNYTRGGVYKLPLTKEAIEYSIESQLLLLLDLDISPDVIVYLENDNNDILAKESLKMKENLLIHLYNYQQAFQCIENFLLHYHQKSVIKVDGRLTQKQLFEQIDNRLLYLSYKEIYKAEKLFSGGIPKEMKNLFVDKDSTECLQILCETNTIQSNLNWLKSNSRTYCPVEMFRGKRIQGNVELAVRYLGYIFFLSSEENLKEFTRYPDKYIFCAPNCRIAIIGSPRSGKSSLAKCLNFLLNSEIYDVKRAVCNLYSDYSENKYAEAFEYAYNQAKELANIRFKYYNQLQKEKVKEWKQNVLVHIKESIDNVIIDLVSLDDLATFLQNKEELNKLIPVEWHTEDQYIDPSYSDPIVNFLLEERLMKLYTQSMVQDGYLARHFLDFAKTQEEKIRVKTNMEKLYGQWIIDDAPLDIRFWEELAKNNCLPDVVLFLSNCSEEKFCEIYGKGLNAKFLSGHHVLFKVCRFMCHYFKQNVVNNKWFSYLKHNIPLNESISKYGNFLAAIKFKEAQEMFKDIERIEELATFNNRTFITVNISNNSWDKTTLTALLRYFALFKSQPRLLNYDELRTLNTISKPESNDKHFNLTEEEEGENEVSENEDEVEVEEEEMEEVEERKNVLNIYENLPMGNTIYYCPVMLMENNILVPCPNPNYVVEYKNLIFTLHSEKCYEKFMENPEKYASFHHKPIVPPPKLWVIGPNHSEKVSFTILFSEELQIKAVSYNNLLQDFMKLSKSTEEISLYTLHDMDNFCVNDCTVNKIKKALKDGAILSGFPATKQQFSDLISYNLYPEAIYIMNDRDMLLKALYNRQLELWTQKIVTPREEMLSAKHDETEYEHDIIEEDEENCSEEGIKYRELTKNDRKEIYQLCKNTLEHFFIALEEMEALANNLNIPVIKISDNFRRPGVIKWLKKNLNHRFDRFRMFDQIFEISMEKAMRLLECGFCRYSRFKTSCPVDVENLILINHFSGSKNQGKIYPCLFREFVYFINGKNNLNKFRLNPYKYINSCNPYQHAVPLRIAVMGPEKSGCTTLCKRIAREFNMRILTKEDLVNIISNELNWTELYRKFVKNNYEISEKILANCMLIYKNATPNGIVLDNFHLDSTYVVEAAKYNVDFHIVLLIKPPFKSSWKIFKEITGYVKQYSPKVLYDSFKDYDDFMEDASAMQNTPCLQLFNITTIDRVNCKWITWNQARYEIFKTTRSIVGYKTNVTKQKSASISHLNVFQSEYNARLPPIGLYCPVCASEGKLNKYRYDFLYVGKKFYSNKCQEELMRPFGYNMKNIYEEFGFPTPWSISRTTPPLFSKFAFKPNMLQHGRYMYWSCNNHIMELLLNAIQYLPIKLIHLPPYVPFLVQNYLKIFVAHEGFCVVSYAKNPADRVLVKGDPKYSIYYRGKVFLVASEKEAFEFLATPQKFYHIKVKVQLQDEVDLDLKAMKLDLGNLTPSLITSALIELAKFRPKHFAMDAQASAAVFIGIFLKLQETESGIKELYEEILENFLSECKILPNRLNKFKHNVNPYIVRNTENLDESISSTSTCRTLQ